MPVSKKAHQTQLPLMPFWRTISATRLGVSEEKVVATIETPSSHQGIFWPDRKKSLKLLPALLKVRKPISNDIAKNPNTNARSIF